MLIFVYTYCMHTAVNTKWVGISAYVWLAAPHDAARLLFFPTAYAKLGVLACVYTCMHTQKQASEFNLFTESQEQIYKNAHAHGHALTYIHTYIHFPHTGSFSLLQKRPLQFLALSSPFEHPMACFYCLLRVNVFVYMSTRGSYVGYSCTRHVKHAWQHVAHVSCETFRPYRPVGGCRLYTRQNLVHTSGNLCSAVNLTYL